MIHYGHCPVCDSSAINKVLHIKDYTVSGESFDIWQCAACCLRFTQDIPDKEDIARYYKSEFYISHSNSQKGIVNRMYLFMRRFTLKFKRQFIERITGLKKGSILDVGAGTGAFLHEMQKSGWKTEGVEPDVQAIQRAADLYSIHLKKPEALFHLPGKVFDVITLWHVLEHVHDLHPYVEQLKLLCRDKGRMLIAVPNYTSADAEHYEAYWAAYDVPRHLYHFSPAAMHTLMDMHGCMIKGMYPMWLDSFYVSLLSEKYQNSRFQLIKGFWNGIESNSRAIANRRRASSIIYEISVNGNLRAE